METEKGLNGDVDGNTEKSVSMPEVEAEALKKCLEETLTKCKSKLEAFQSSSSSSSKKPLRLRSGSLTDV